MRKLTYILLLFAFVAQGQIINPVKWKTKVVQKSKTEFELVMDATIEKEWHMYSQFTPEDGPLPTVFDYKNAKGNFSLVGKTKESAYKKVFNDIFEVDEYYFANTAQFKQVIKVTNAQLKEVKVYVEYQVCKEQCIQQDETFTFKLPEIKPIVADSQSVETALSDVNTTDSTSINKENSGIENSVDSKGVGVNETNAEENEEEKSLWGIFILAFLGGFAALLTPCVFPMIPMTVSFFTKQSKTKAAGIKNAFIYGISIIVIYVGLGMIITALFGIDSLNALSTNVWFNVIFFVILIVFAASFLGAFEIVLPNSFLNKKN